MSEQQHRPDGYHRCSCRRVVSAALRDEAEQAGGGGAAAAGGRGDQEESEGIRHE